MKFIEECKELVTVKQSAPVWNRLVLPACKLEELGHIDGYSEVILHISMKFTQQLFGFSWKKRMSLNRSH